jgi:hypothetical protein
MAGLQIHTTRRNLPSAEPPKLCHTGLCITFSRYRHSIYANGVTVFEDATVRARERNKRRETAATTEKYQPQGRRVSRRPTDVSAGSRADSSRKDRLRKGRHPPRRTDRLGRGPAREPSRRRADPQRHRRGIRRPSGTVLQAISGCAIHAAGLIGSRTLRGLFLVAPVPGGPHTRQGDQHRPGPQAPVKRARTLMSRGDLRRHAATTARRHGDAIAPGPPWRCRLEASV